MDGDQFTGLPDYRRLEHDGLGIYVHPEYPDWFVPSRSLDRLLRTLPADCSLDQAIGCCGISVPRPALERLLSRLARGPIPAYAGRAAHLDLRMLKECWLHLTNRCNLRCTHCMFCSGPTERRQLTPEQLAGAVEQARSLGCKLFYCTGGEPLVHDGFLTVCRQVLEDPQAHVVILTNAVALPTYADAILTLDRDRTHFQVSLDGTEQTNDDVRGRGAFRRIDAGVRLLRSNGFPVSLAMSVSQTNVHQMQELVAIAAAWDVANIHYLWFFRKGQGLNCAFVPASEIAAQLLRAYDRAQDAGTIIDNIDIIKSQVFSLPGTRFDLSNAGWQSLAVGPDGGIYPSAALIGEPGMRAGHLADGLEAVWINSPLLQQVRRASVAHDPVYSQNPLKYLVGGGDLDHSLSASGAVTGGDPYVEVYNRIALAVIAEQARQYRDDGRLAVLSRMGERLYQCGDDLGEVAFTHSNCVLTLPDGDGHALVKNFYTAAAAQPNEDISNPVHYDESDIGHVPDESRIRSYGCGSPVLDCELRPGETLVDLGSGTGVECFIAARKVGPAGKVIGIDMAEAMLAVAQRARAQVAANLGYDNVEFRQAFFEEAPVESDSVDVVISNCVINLSPDKRRTFSEILRMLRPGGRAIISDICSDDDIPLGVRYNQKLRGECIGGAFRQRELFALLEDVGFEAAWILKRFLYRTVAGYRFYSITYRVAKPARTRTERMLYRGPFAGLLLADGQIVEKGATTEVELPEDMPVGDSVFLLDEDGNPTNVQQEGCCSCLTPTPHRSPNEPNPTAPRHITGCMVCGADLVYSQTSRKLACYYCSRQLYGNVVCESGHFVCDKCHAHDALSIIEEVCFGSEETDMMALMARIRSHPAFPMHGPEHHSMVPAIILTTYRNITGRLGRDQVLTGMKRGGAIAGGSCAFYGVCGAASGVGIAFSIILRCDPYRATERQTVQRLTARVLQAIGRYEAPRCCQRDCWTALIEAARLSKRYIGVRLNAQAELPCSQARENRECIGAMCPLYHGPRNPATPGSVRSRTRRGDEEAAHLLAR
jgi:MoaA/NifB/PqqE/SkfB family radical SAM enzyme/SAM-dependent methyltransferase